MHTTGYVKSLEYQYSCEYLDSKMQWLHVIHLNTIFTTEMPFFIWFRQGLGIGIFNVNRKSGIENPPNPAPTCHHNTATVFQTIIDKIKDQLQNTKLQFIEV